MQSSKIIAGLLLSWKLHITVNSVLVHSPLEDHRFLTLIFQTLKIKFLIARETSLNQRSTILLHLQQIHTAAQKNVNYPHLTLATIGKGKSEFNIRLCKCSLGRREGQEETVLQFQAKLGR